MKIKLKQLLFHQQGPLTQSLRQTKSDQGLGNLPEKLQPTALVKLVCGFCSTGCNLIAHQKEGKTVNLTPDKAFNVNQGKACPKGWQGLVPLDSPDRVSQPQMKRADGSLQPISWERAAELFVQGFQKIQKTASSSANAFLSTGQIVTEEMAFLGSLAKFGMGMLHGDGNTRQCMATAATAYKQSFGFDAPPFSYEDLEESDVLVFVGANPCINHPILWKRVLANQQNPKIIVIDPRKTQTAQAATAHYPLRPKSDLILFYGLAHWLIGQGAIDKDYIEAHTQGFNEFAAFVEAFPLSQVAAATGLNESLLLELGESIQEGKRVSFWWTMGVNQSHQGVLVAQALINLALMTGNLGRPGTGANSITGQCNAMGSRLFSNTTNLLGGHEFANSAHRGKVARILKIEESSIPQENSLDYQGILEEVEAGKIKGLWVIATNPAHSWIDPARWKRLREKLDFLVVQDLYPDTATAKMADLFLPAAAWGEKEGTLINSERRFAHVAPAHPKPAGAKTDFEIFRLLGQAWGLHDLVARFGSPKQTFALLQELSQGQPCDFSGIAGYEELKQKGGVQWPQPRAEGVEKKRLFAEGEFFHPQGKAHFCFGEPLPPAGRASFSFPLILLTGRGSSVQWHTGTRTERAPILKKMSPRQLYVEVNPLDAENLGFVSGQSIWVESKQGKARAQCLISPQVALGQVFMPMHYPEVNWILLPDFDPQSKQPSYKYTPVRLLKS